MSENNFDWDVINAFFTDTRRYEASDNEVNVFSNVKSSLESFSSSHENFLSGSLDDLDVGGDGIAKKYYTANTKYNGLIDKLQGVLGYQDIDTGGGVSGGYGGTSGGSTGGSTGSYDSSPNVDLASIGASTTTPTLESAGPIPSKGTSGSSKSTTSDSSSILGNQPKKSIEYESSDTPVLGASVSSSGGSSSSGSDSSFTSSKSMMTSIGAAGSTGLGVAGISSMGKIVADVGGLGGVEDSPALSNTNYVSGNYVVNKPFDEFSEEQKAEISSILRKNGYSNNQIDEVLNGDYNTSEVLVENVSSELVGLTETNPEVRNVIVDKYGFDVFNDDGSINNDNLSLALYIDDLDGKDNYSMISMLSSQYGVDMVDSDTLSEYSDRLEEVLLVDFEVKKTIKEQYGFDVYNIDGSVNRDRLTVAMLIDERETDSNNKMVDIINEYSSSMITGNLDANIKRVDTEAVNDKSRRLDNLTTTAAAFAAGGAAVGIGIASSKALKEKKEEKEFYQDNNDKLNKIDEDLWEKDNFNE